MNLGNGMAFLRDGLKAGASGVLNDTHSVLLNYCTGVLGMDGIIMVSYNA